MSYNQMLSGKSAGSRAFLDHLHPQHGDRTGSSAGRIEPVRAIDDFARPDRRGHPRRSAVSDPASDRSDDHHVCAATDAVAAARGVRELVGGVWLDIMCVANYTADGLSLTRFGD